MNPAIGPLAQIQKHRAALDLLEKYAKKLKAHIKSGQILDVDAAINELTEILPFTKLSRAETQTVLRITGMPVFEVIIDHMSPEKGMKRLAGYLLGKKPIIKLNPFVDVNGRERMPMERGVTPQEIIAQEFEYRWRENNDIIQTDALTAWIIAAEGRQNQEVDLDQIKNQILEAQESGTLIDGQAANIIRRGYDKLLRNSPQQSACLQKATVYWPNWPPAKNQGVIAIPRIEITGNILPAGTIMRSSVRFSSKLEVGSYYLNIKSIVLPSSLIISLKGQKVERILDEQRIHGWGWECTAVDYCEFVDNRRNADPNKRMVELFLKINREDSQNQVCFTQ